MRTATLGPLGPVSRLTLGGGGIGQIWGETTAEEARATLQRRHRRRHRPCSTPRPATATARPSSAKPSAGACRPACSITTKHALATVPPGEAAGRLAASLEASLKAMRLERVDLFFLHSNIRPDDFIYAHGADRQDQVATRFSQYAAEVVPAMQALQAAGKIGCLGDHRHRRAGRRCWRRWRCRPGPPSCRRSPT